MKARLRRLLNELSPLPRRLPGMTRADLQADALAGLTVGVMLVPQAMAYALLAGLPPALGLTASLVPLVIYALTGRSRQVAVGIVALDMLILGEGLGRVGDLGDAERAGLAILAALLVGLIQVAMSTLRLGFLVNFLSRPVILGFTTAAPVLIAVSQLDTLLGLSVPRQGFLHQSILALGRALPDASLAASALGLGCCVALVLLKRAAPRLPGALVVVVAAGAITAGFGLGPHGVETLGALDAPLPGPRMPDADLSAVRALLPTAVTLALVQFMTLLSLGRSFAARTGQRLSADQELRALGLSNMVGSFFQAVPVSASFSRSAINADAGARSGLSHLFAAGTVLLAMLFAGPLFAHVPLPALAAIILVSSLGLISPSALRVLFRVRRTDGWIALGTTALVLVFGIQEGVLLGVGGAMFLMLARMSRPAVVPLGRREEHGRYRPRVDEDGPDAVDGVLVLRVDGSLTFVNAEYVIDVVIEYLDREPEVTDVVLDGRSVNDIDATAVHAVLQLARDLAQQGVTLSLSSFKDRIEDVLKRGGLGEELEGAVYFSHVTAAVQAARERRARAESSGGDHAGPLDDTVGL